MKALTDEVQLCMLTNTVAASKRRDCERQRRSHCVAILSRTMQVDSGFRGPATLLEGSAPSEPHSVMASSHH